ncbi:MAG: phosphotransferase [Desulfurivibrionaceae bacterium]
MILEMHCHTSEHSGCSHVRAGDLIHQNFENGLQGTVLTDHHYLWPAEEIEDLRAKLAVPDYYLILSGQEVATPEIGDILVYGATRSLAKGTPLSEIREEFPEAALVWAHPFRKENIPVPEELLSETLDAIEIFSSNHTVLENYRGLAAWHRHRFTAIAGTDTHAFSYAGVYPTLFDHPVTGIDELAGEIRAGRCRPYLKEIPHAGTTNTKVTELTIGIDGAREKRERIVIKTPENAQAWESAATTQQIMTQMAEQIFHRDKRFRLPLSLGKDKENLAIFEQGIGGRTLFEVILEVRPKTAPKYLRLTAQWLTHLHNARLRLTPPEKFLDDEFARLDRYLSAFHRINHPHTRRAQELMETILATEEDWYRNRLDTFVQGHGDFHPKNIYVGDKDHSDPNRCFIAAIDFDSSYCMPRAFDVGTFLMQFRNQFYEWDEVREKVDGEVFLREYLEQANDLERDFPAQVELFKARTTLSICYYLIKVGLGDSENLWRVLVEAENGLAGIAAKKAATPA